MKKHTTCPDCGKIFEGSEVPAECPNCGCSSEFFAEVTEKELEEVGISHTTSDLSQNISTLLESSNDYAAEKLGAILADITKAIGYIIMIGSFIAGLVYAANSYDGWIIFLIIFGGGLLLGFLFLCAWAWLRLLVNISYRLTRIDNKTKAK